MELLEQKCINCKFARASSYPNRGGKTWMSCRFSPPHPNAEPTKTTELKNWRIVPEDFWCGQWQEFK